MADKIIGTEETPFTGLRMHNNGDDTFSMQVYDTAAGGGGGGGAVTIADGADITLGMQNDSAANSDTGVFSLIALIKRLLGKLPTLVSGRMPVDLAAAPNVTTTMQNAAVATGNGTVLDVSGMTAARFEVAIAGTATITWEASSDGGTTYSGVNVAGTSGTRGPTATATGRYAIGCAGLTHIRARISAWSSGAVTVVGHGVAGGDIAGALSYNTDATLQAAATATGNGTALDVSGYDTVGLQVSGTFVGTITWEVTSDGTNFIAVPFADMATGVQSSTCTTTGVIVRRSVAGTKQVRARISAYTSGSITVTAHAVVSGIGGQIPVGLYGKSSNAGDTALQLESNGQPRVTLYTATGTALTLATSGDGNGGAFLGLGAMQFNGTNFDRPRNNQEATVLASAARSADTNSGDQTNMNARGVVLTIDLTVLGSTNLVFTIKYKDTLSGKYVTLLASASLTGTGTTQLTICPGATPAANAALSMPLPRLWRVEAVRGGTPGTDTYSVSANYIS